MQIVLARLEDDQEVVKLGRVDLGERHTFRAVKKPVACRWLEDGTAADLEKAVRYAKAQGYLVFCYEGEADPLGRARRDVARARWGVFVRSLVGSAEDTLSIHAAQEKAEAEMARQAALRGSLWQVWVAPVLPAAKG